MHTGTAHIYGVCAPKKSRYYAGTNPRKEQKLNK